MNKQKIRNLIEDGESQKVEFKEYFNKETIETASAFANANGGTILIGINNKGRIKGVSVGKESLKEWVNKIFQATEPILIPEIESCEIRNKNIVVLTIKESPIKPIAYKGICFLRVKNSNRKLSPKEVSEFHLQTTGSSWDSYLARGAVLEDINLEKVEDYIKLANETGRKKIKEKPLEVLKKLELVKNNKPTWAAILLFGKEPQRFISQAKIHCGRFKDEITIIDDETIEGTLIEQVDKTLGFIKRHLKLKFEITGEPRRKEEWEYPLDALREAVINAICHRDYTEPSEIQIRIYDDKLIVWSSGKLPLGIVLEDLHKSHKSVLRNKLIAQVFFDMAFIEKWGSGIQRMIQLCLNQKLSEPEFDEQQGFRTIFERNEGVNEGVNALFRYIKKNSGKRVVHFEKDLGVPAKTIERWITKLRTEGKIEFKGSSKTGGYWEIIQKLK